MSRTREQLTESRDSWMRSGDKERFRGIINFIGSTVGGIIAAVGIAGVGEGKLVDVATITVGAGLVIAGIKYGIERMDSATECYEKATVFEYQMTELSQPAYEGPSI